MKVIFRWVRKHQLLTYVIWCVVGVTFWAIINQVTPEQLGDQLGRVTFIGFLIFGFKALVNKIGAVLIKEKGGKGNV